MDQSLIQVKHERVLSLLRFRTSESIHRRKDVRVLAQLLGRLNRSLSNSQRVRAVNKSIILRFGCLQGFSSSKITFSLKSLLFYSVLTSGKSSLFFLIMRSHF
jgi:hypothetical protein